MRETDTVARFGGDEFTVLVGDVSRRDDVAELAEDPRLFTRPSWPVDGSCTRDTSVGVALFPDDGDDLDTLLKSADIAMYPGQGGGRDSFEFYTPGPR